MRAFQNVSRKEAGSVEGGDVGIVVLVIGIVLAIRFWGSFSSLFGR